MSLVTRTHPFECAPSMRSGRFVSWIAMTGTPPLNVSSVSEYADKLRICDPYNPLPATWSLTKNVPSGVGVPGAPLVVWVSSTNVDPSHTCIVFVVRSTRTDINVDDNVTCDVGIQPVLWFGRTGNCTRSHSPSSERCTTRSFNGLPKYVGFVIPHAVVGSYSTTSVPPGSVTGANNVTSGTIVATNVDKYVGETIGSGSGSATAGAGATTTGVSTGCVELTLAASGTSTTSGTTETGVFSAARSAATPSTCGIATDDTVGSGGVVDAPLPGLVTAVAISTGSSRDSTPSRGAADAIATPLAVTTKATPTRTTPRFTAKKGHGCLSAVAPVR